MAVIDKLSGAAAVVYRELLNRFGPNPTDLAPVVTAAVQSYARRLGVTDPTVLGQITNMVLAVGITESGLRNVPASTPGETSYGPYQLNTGGKGAGFTKDELLDPIANVAIAADYLVRAAIGPVSVQPGLPGSPFAGGAFDPNAAARRMILEEQAPKGSITIRTGQPQQGESQADVNRVQGMIDYVAQAATQPPGQLGHYTGQPTAPTAGAASQITWPDPSEYVQTIVNPDGSTSQWTDWETYTAAIESLVRPYAGAGAPLPAGAPQLAQMVYDSIKTSDAAERDTTRSTNLANYVNALVSSIGADVASRRLSMEEATAEFNRQLDAMQYGTEALEAILPYTIPEGAEYIPGFEPGGIATKVGMEPVKASPFEYNPFATAASLVSGTPSPAAAGAPAASNLFDLALQQVQSQPGPATTPAANLPPAAAAPTVAPLGLSPSMPAAGPMSAQPGNSFEQALLMSAQPGQSTFPPGPMSTQPGLSTFEPSGLAPAPAPARPTATPTPEPGWYRINGQWRWIGPWPV